MLIRAARPSFQLDADSISLSWFGQQRLEGVRIQKDNALLTCPSIVSTTPLWKILLKKESHLTLSQAQLQAEAITVKDINLDLDWPSGSVHATGTTTQGTLTGSFTVDGAITSLETLQLKAKFVNFPVPILDAFSTSNLSSLIGSTVNADLAIASTPQAFEMTMDANSPQFTAHAQTKMDTSCVTLQGPATLSLKTPDATVFVQVDNFCMPLADKEAFSFHSKVDIAAATPIHAVVATDSYKSGIFNVSLQLPQLGINNLKLTLEQNRFLLQKSDDLWDIDLSFAYKNGDLALTKPGKIGFTLTPDLLPQGPFVLTKPTPVTFKLTRLDLKNKTYEGDVTIDNLSFTETTTQQATQLSRLTLHVAQSQELTVDLKANVLPQGSLTLQGTPSNFTLKAQQFPTSVLDLFAVGFARTRIAFAPILGTTVDLTASATLKNQTGPVKLDISSPTCKASLSGSLNQGIFSLSDTFYAQLAVTPQLGEAFLGIPTLNSPVPISLKIPAPGVAIPVSPLIKDQIQIPAMRLELGQIFCKNEGNLNIAMGLLKLSQFGKSSSLKVWFAPCDLHVKNGIATCERTEILVADAYQVCLFGTIDLPRNWVDMTLGLTAGCLKKAFGIKNLPDSYIIPIPVTGPIENVQIDSGKATGKIAALLLWQQKALAGSAVGGPAGAFLGDMLDKLGPLPGEDVKAPPPKHPFPWETEPPPTNEETPVKKKKKHFTGHEKPLDQLLKFIK